MSKDFELAEIMQVDKERLAKQIEVMNQVPILSVFPLFNGLGNTFQYLTFIKTLALAMPETSIEVSLPNEIRSLSYIHLPKINAKKLAACLTDQL